MKKLLMTLSLVVCSVVLADAQTERSHADRALWGSLAAPPGKDAINNGDYLKSNNKVLITWRMLPGDDENTAFDLYRAIGDEEETCVNDPLGMGGRRSIKATNYQHALFDGTVKGDIHYRLTYAGDTTTIGRYTMKLAQYNAKQPFIEIPLQDTKDVSPYSDIVYQANDCSVGDLDGDGQMEIVVKRLLTILNADGSVKSDGTGAGSSDRRARHCVVWDAYKLDGTLLWRIKSGPNIILGNSSNFGVADLDGDGRCEFVTKTGEGTVFGDGTEIADTDGDGVTDYRDNWSSHYTGTTDKGPGGPEFFSVCDGLTGRELARADFINPYDRGTTWKQQSESWGDDYWKRANSLRLGIASFDGKKNQIFIGRGVYARTVVEGWDYADGQLTRLWHFDSSNAGGRDVNKDGKPYSAYASQGNHSFTVADLDGDGRDEVMYGSAAFDDDGTGLWTTGLGHGDAQHVGHFIPEREGMQVFHCLETGVTEVAVHDAKDGSTIWAIVAPSAGDQGRCLVADVDPTSPGCEFWKYGNELYSQNGKELYNDKGERKTENSCNMAIWFDGYLNRQLINEGIINSYAHGRTFTMYRWSMAFNNGTKSNPGWYGDMLGDWREEVITPDATKLANIKVFSTWYPTDHRFPWLMTDHTYRMAVINENVGYNQPPNVGYYLGSDLLSDSQAWQEAATMQDLSVIHEKTTGINNANLSLRKAHSSSTAVYNLMGQRVERAAKGTIYLLNGRKVIRR